MPAESPFELRGAISRLAVAALLLSGLAAAQPRLAVEQIAQGLPSPVALEAPRDGSGLRFVADQTGTIHVLTPDGVLVEEPFLDVAGRMVELIEGFEERGLLGLAFHPEYGENGRFFVHYSAPLREGAPGGWDHTARISEFRVGEDDPRRADPDSERVLLEVDQVNRKTNGGALAFGPDGYLYISMGEGGGAHGIGEVVYDALEVPERMNVWDFQAQDLDTLYGKILRIDVDRGWPGYGIPEDNPLVNREGRDEIWAWGFRNHYRMSFDHEGRGDLFVAAVSEGLWESVYLVDRPGNYGWPIKEGSHCYDRQNPLDPPEECPSRGPNGWPILDPVVEYANLNLFRSPLAEDGQVEPAGTAVVGAYVYRGESIPALQGSLLFADYSADPENPSGQLFVAHPAREIGSLWPWERALRVEARIQGMGRDAEGEIYLLTREAFAPSGDTGKVFRVVQAEAGEAEEAQSEEAGNGGAGGAGDETAERDPEGDAAAEDVGGEAAGESAGESPGEPSEEAAGERSGLYSVEQAERGLADYQEHCQQCHGRNLQGEDPFPPLTGTRFMRNWEGMTLYELFDYTRHNMPLGMPGSLDEQTYLDVMAHWLRFHEYPEGEQELSAEREELERIIIEPQPQEGR